MKVQCPNCKVLCHETTDAFNPDVRPDRSMVELLEPWRAWGHGDGWQDLECPACLSPLAPSGRLRVVSDDYGQVEVKTLSERNQEWLEKAWMDLAPEDRCTHKIPVKILDEDISKAERIREIVDDVPFPDEDKVYGCDCGKVCKSNAGLVSHMRSHKGVR